MNRGRFLVHHFLFLAQRFGVLRTQPLGVPIEGKQPVPAKIPRRRPLDFLVIFTQKTKNILLRLALISHPGVRECFAKHANIIDGVSFRTVQNVNRQRAALSLRDDQPRVVLSLRDRKIRQVIPIQEPAAASRRAVSRGWERHVSILQGNSF